MKSFTPLYYLLGLSLSLSLITACNPKEAPDETGRVDNKSAQKIADDLGDDFEEIANRVLPTVVSISTTQKMPADETHAPFMDPEQGGGGLGSGVIIDAEKGYILTNNHVIADANEIAITLQNDTRRYEAAVIGTDPPTDLAVLQMKKPPRLQAAVLGDSNQLKVGEWVLAIGSPFGLDSTVTAGIISAKSRAEVGVADFEDFLQTDAAINPGNSGGALVNTQGELVGINTAIATRTMGYMGIGFAIPSAMVKRVMQELITQGKVTRSQLGVYIEPIDATLRKGLKLPEDQEGILVSEVIPNTPASESGFQKYDVIIGLNDQNVTRVQSFRNQIALTSPGEKVKIQVLRQGKAVTLTPQLREANTADLGTPGDNAMAERLGFQLEPLTEALKQQLGLPDSFQGLAVTEIEPQSNAAQQGLQRGDIITEVNQQSVSSWPDVVKALEQVQPGDAVLVNLVRNGQNQIMAFKMPAPR